jgi:hypothetical protein
MVVPAGNASARASQTSSWCRYEPLRCFAQQAIEVGFFVGAFLVLFAAANNFDLAGLPLPLNVLKFGLVFLGIGYSARLMSDSLGDKVSFAAMSAVGQKTLSLMIPRLIGW